MAASLDIYKTHKGAHQLRRTTPQFAGEVIYSRCSMLAITLSCIHFKFNQLLNA